MKPPSYTDDGQTPPEQHPCQLIICRNLYPANRWHWSVLMPDGHCYATSGESFASLDTALDSASILGAAVLEQAERDWSSGHPRYAKAMTGKNALSSSSSKATADKNDDKCPNDHNDDK